MAAAETVPIHGAPCARRQGNDVGSKPFFGRTGYLFDLYAGCNALPDLHDKKSQMSEE